MKLYTNSVMAKPTDVNPVTKLWDKVETNQLLLNQLSEFINLAEIAMISL